MKLFFSECVLTFMVNTCAQPCYASLIHQFAKQHNWQVVMTMVAEGHDPNEICDDGLSLLSIACHQKDWDAVKTLLIHPEMRLPKGLETVDAVRLKQSQLRSICDGIGPADKVYL